MSYIGNEPIVSATRTVTEIVATSGQTTFTANGGYTVGYLDVFVNGAQLQATDFTATNGSTVTLTNPAVLNDDVRLVAWGTFSVASINGANITDGTVTTAKIADANVTGAKLENSGVTAGTYGSASAIPAITVDAKGRVTSASTNSFSSSYVGGRGQVFTTSGTFTVPTGVTAVKVTCIGGGGSGGSSSGQLYGGGGGGSSTPGMVWITGLTPGASISVTVGAGGTGPTGNNTGASGGTSSFSTYISASGGGGGGPGSNAYGGGRGAAPTGSGVYHAGIAFDGNRGGSDSCAGSLGGAGATSMFGFGASGGSSGAGSNATGYGAGGSGSGSGGAKAGNGSGGLVIVEW